MALADLSGLAVEWHKNVTYGKWESGDETEIVTWRDH